MSREEWARRQGEPAHYVDVTYAEISEQCPDGLHVLIDGRELCIPRSDIAAHDRKAQTLRVRGYPAEARR